MENKIIAVDGIDNPTQLTLGEIKKLVASNEFKFVEKADFVDETAGFDDNTVFEFKYEWMDSVTPAITDYVRTYEYKYPNPKAENPEDSDIVLRLSLRRTQEDNSLSAYFSGEEQWG